MSESVLRSRTAPHPHPATACQSSHRYGASAFTACARMIRLRVLISLEHSYFHDVRLQINCFAFRHQRQNTKYSRQAMDEESDCSWRRWRKRTYMQRGLRDCSRLPCQQSYIGVGILVLECVFRQCHCLPCSDGLKRKESS